MCRDGKREDRQQEAGEDLAKRCQRQEPFDGGIDHEAEERDEQQHEQRIDRLNLALQPFDAEEPPVHLLRLLHPRPARLIVKRPEHGHEQVERHELEDGGQALRAERLGKVPRAPWRHVDEAVPSQPEHERGQRHEDARHAEGPAGAIGAQQPGREQRREERAEVDREVEPAEHPLEQVTV